MGREESLVQRRTSLLRRACSFLSCCSSRVIASQPCPSAAQSRWTCSSSSKGGASLIDRRAAWPDLIPGPHSTSPEGGWSTGKDDCAGLETQPETAELPQAVSTPRSYTTISHASAQQSLSVDTAMATPPRLRKGRAAWSTLAPAAGHEGGQRQAQPPPVPPAHASLPAQRLTEFLPPNYTAPAQHGGSVAEETEEEDAEAATTSLSTAANLHQPSLPRSTSSRPFRSGTARPSRRATSSSHPPTASSTSSTSTWLSTSRQLQVLAAKLEREVNLPSKAASWLALDAASHPSPSPSIPPPTDTPDHRDLLSWARIEESRRDERRREAVGLTRGIGRLRAAVGPFIGLMRAHQRRMRRGRVVEAGEEKTADDVDEEEQLQGEMERVEELLTRFKRQQRDAFLALDFTEKQLHPECTLHDQRISQWLVEPSEAAPPPPAPRRRAPLASARPTSAERSRPAGLVLVEGELAALHVTGHWPSDDHARFVSLFYSSPSDSVLLSRMLVELAHYGEEECRAHLRWWRKWLRLNDEKKSLVKQWRDDKQKQQTQLQEKALHPRAAEDDDEDDPEDSAAQRQAREQQQREEQLAAVARWKAEKAESDEHARRVREEEEARAARAKERRRASYHAQQKLALRVAQMTAREREAEEEARLRMEREERREEEERRRREGERRLQEQHLREVEAKVEERREREREVRGDEERRRRLLEVSAAIVGAKAERSSRRVQGRTEASELRACAIEEGSVRRREAQRQGKVGQMQIAAIAQQPLITPQWRVGL